MRGLGAFHLAFPSPFLSLFAAADGARKLSGAGSGGREGRLLLFWKISPNKGLV